MEVDLMDPTVDVMIRATADFNHNTIVLTAKVFKDDELFDKTTMYLKSEDKLVAEKL